MVTQFACVAKSGGSGTPAEIQAQKAALRKTMREWRNRLGSGQRARLSALMQAHILGSKAWQDSIRPGLYWPLADEPDTEVLVCAGRNEKRPLLPHVISLAEGRMEFLACADPGSLIPGPFGLREPEPGLPEVPDLVIAPGLAFDLEGRRLGYGGGFYDRYLASEAREAPVIGFAFSRLIVEKLPGEAHDRKVDAICTEHGLQWL